MMRIVTVCLAATLALLPLSCGSVLPVSPAPLYYRLVYDPQPVHCDRSFPRGVRVWRFTEASPFGHSEMTVLEPGVEVAFSSANRWVSAPGTLIAEGLIRDLTLDETFPQVVSDESPAVVPYDITGRVFEFGWRKEKASGKAVLKAEVCLVRKTGTPEVIFRRVYEVESGPFGENSAASFASGMSEAVGRFSRDVRLSLCNAAAEASPAVGHDASVPPDETKKGTGSW
jgi:ABC-type uncharacterized transport system auxiliary subunit